MTTARAVRKFLLLPAISTVAALACSSAAQAQLFSPCMVLGSPMPPPCIVLDSKSLADWAQRHVAEVQKVAQAKQFIDESVSQTKGIGETVQSLANFKIDLQIPKFNLPQNPFTGSGSGILDVKGKIGGQFFTGSDSSTTAGARVNAQREKIASEAYVDAWSSGAAAGAESDHIATNIAALQKEVAESTNLRGDWAANSHIKQEIIAARAQNMYLLTAFLKMQAAGGVRNTELAAPIGTPPAALIAAARDLPSSDGMWDKVREIDGLYSRAQSLLASLGIVQMGQSIQATIQSVITDYENTVARKQSAYQQLTNDAIKWTNESGHGSYTNTLNVIGTALSNMDGQMASLRGQSTDQLASAFSSRNIDATGMLQNEVDPRQFIGTWTDPLKYQNTINLANDLLSHSLDSTVDGDNGTADEFRADVYNWNDVRLEEAWKKPYADEAKQQLVDVQAQIDVENQKQGLALSAESIAAELQQIVTKANSIGQTISASNDEAAKAAAAKTLTDLQTLLNGGTALPPVESTASSGGSGQPSSSGS